MFLVFVAICGYASVYLASDYYYFRDGLANLRSSINTLNEIKTNLTAEITRLSREESVYSSSLSIMQQELPTIEIFDSIDKSTVRGVILSSVALTQKDIKIDGLANTEDNIVTTTRNLLDSEAFVVAQVPVVTRENMGPEGLKFSLTLTPKAIGESGQR
jgi:Tfp pilus assembly protein PilN